MIFGDIFIWPGEKNCDVILSAILENPLKFEYLRPAIGQIFLICLLGCEKIRGKWGPTEIHKHHNKFHYKNDVFINSHRIK